MKKAAHCAVFHRDCPIPDHRSFAQDAGTAKKTTQEGRCQGKKAKKKAAKKADKKTDDKMKGDDK